jgi:hypothetical protein
MWTLFPILLLFFGCRHDFVDSFPFRRSSSTTSKSNHKKGNSWWKGMDFEDHDGSDNNEISDEFLAAEEVLSPLQLEPLLQIPCGIQLALHRHDKQFYGKNNNDSTSKRHPPKTRQHAIAAFCDTGAQRTVMTWASAQRVGLGHLLDRRYAGHATGMGSCRVLGRIPANSVELVLNGDVTIIAPVITIIETTGTPGVDLLLGLDFLRDVQAVIDLQQEELRLIIKNGGTKEKETTISIPFIRPRSSPRVGSDLPRGDSSDLFDNNLNDQDDYSDSDLDEVEEGMDMSGL